MDGVFNVLMCFFTCHLGVILVKYIFKVDKLNVSFKMRQFKTYVQESRFKIYSSFIMKPFFSIQFIISSIKIVKRFGIINVKKCYFWNELVNMVFKIILSLEKNLNKHVVKN